MRRATVAAAGAALLVATGCGTRADPPATAPPATTARAAPAQAAPDLAATSSQLGPWRLVGHETAFGPAADQGVATVGGRVVYRGDLDVTDAEQRQGWDHIGDPDAAGGSIVDAFQGPPGATAKMFLLTTATGATRQFVHPLAPGELANNSFAAISPDGRWLVAGEWFTERRLLVFPAPTPTAPAGPLALAGQITLDRPAGYIQGCDFVTATRLLCVSDDPGTTLWPTPFPLLQVDLAAPLATAPSGATSGMAAATAATVTDLGGLPLVSRCRGAFEPEGVDYDPASGILRVEVSPPSPCSVAMTVYDYRLG